MKFAFKWGSLLAVGAALVAMGSPAGAATYYISNSQGNDANNGLSTTTPWKSFTAVNQLYLQPGDQVRLRGGDTWTTKMNLQGVGNATNPIVLGTYGPTGNAIIQRADPNVEFGIVVNNPSYWRISGFDIKNCRIGLFLRYTDSWDNQDVQVSNCYFENCSNGAQNVNANLYNREYAWCAGLWAGGRMYDVNETRTVLTGLKVSFCSFNGCDMGFGSDWYWPQVITFKRRLVNPIFEDCFVTNCLGAFTLGWLDGGIVRRIRCLNNGGYYVNGTTAGFAQNCNGTIIDDCEFAGTKRINCRDGVGFDFEGNNSNMTFSNNVVHDNDGPALLVMASLGNNNTNVNFVNNTFYNNARNPFDASTTVEMLAYSNSTGSISNCGFYKGTGVSSVFSTQWGGFSQSNIRDTTYGTVSGRPNTWEFNTNFNRQGWVTFNQWTMNDVSDGVMYGLSTGADPFVVGPATWLNSHEKPKVRVRMRQSAGAWGQIFYTTETDGAWNQAKSVLFPITADSTQREYTVDLNQSDVRGVITGLRLDPTNANNSSMAVDYIRTGNW